MKPYFYHFYRDYPGDIYIFADRNCFDKRFIGKHYQNQHYLFYRGFIGTGCR